MGSQRSGARRTWSWTRHCAHAGCHEFARYEYSTRREMDTSQRATKGEWRCVRHYKPDEVLSPTNTRRVTEVTATRDPDRSRSFWGLPLGNGFAHGLGWKAWADDFPAGTRIRVTVDVLPPRTVTHEWALSWSTDRDFLERCVAEEQRNGWLCSDSMWDESQSQWRIFLSRPLPASGGERS
jgi:hypothetical protein